VHWVYFPDRATSFYRIGYYDNIFDTDRLSLYVELGYARDAAVDVDAHARAGARRPEAPRGRHDHKLVAEHSVVMDPAYVHITTRSNAELARLRRVLQANGVYSIGRYGGWTYCSIEDNIVEARALAADFSALAAIQQRLGKPLRDDDALKLFSEMRRRPDGKFQSPLYVYFRAALRLLLLARPTSEREYDAVLRRLERSARTFRTDGASTWYQDKVLVDLLGRL
jgi:hypothetical protein